MNKTRGFLAGVATLAVLISAAACAPSTQQAADGFEPEPVETESTEPLEESTEPLDEGSTEAEPSEEPTEEETPLYHFGDTVTYENGLKVTIGKPTTLKDYAYPEDVKKGQKVIRFKITVDNQTDHRLDPSEFTMTASSGDDEAEFAIDSENGLEGTPDTKVLRGKKRSWDYGYIVNKNADFVLEISPDYETEETIFTS